MSKPSIFQQLDAVPVSPRNLLESPRHWNCGLIRFKDRLWMTYRYHIKKQQGRCATALVEIDHETFQPKGKSQWLTFSGAVGSEHHEDARLFIFKDDVYVSFTEMRGYRPGIDYTCSIKYAKLKLTPKRWEIVDIWKPVYGANDGRAKEKNWVFFEYDDALHAVYTIGGVHQVIRLRGETVEQVYNSQGPAWHFGHLRGGTTPLLQSDGTFLSVFHSSLPTEIAPHYVRYYAGAYTFEGQPPFTPMRISNRPIMVGSEMDGHQVDPRYVEGWKPYVVFPCGLVERDPGKTSGWLVSLGVNDWQCAIAQLKPNQLFLGAANGSDIAPRYFKRSNGSVPVGVFSDGGRKKMLEWIVPRSPFGMVGAGYMMCTNPREAQEVCDTQGVKEITFEEYNFSMMQMKGTLPPRAFV